MPPHSRTVPAQDGKTRHPRRIALDAVLERVAVSDRQRALTNLAAISGRVTSGVMAVLPSLLSEVPDPDGALNGLERFTAAARPQTLRLLDRNPRIVHYLLVVFGYSPYLSDTLIQNPEVLSSFARRGELERSGSAEDYRLAFANFSTQALERDLSLKMARFRRRQYIGIMLRDVLGVATLADTTAELSALADALIAEALRVAQDELAARYGAPAGRMAVISLGKLGGNELNYSSDIDLLFIYAGDPGAACGELSTREFNVRLAQRTSELLALMTPEGPVYRVDLRLRPRGSEGEPAIGLDHAVSYYAGEAHDWELQAMIKARHSAGDEGVTQEFLARIEPFVYRSSVNFAAVETALIARRRMSRRKAGGLWARTATAGIDVKVGRGGIRDIEFLAQCLQRVYAGPEPWLRSRSTLFALQKLNDKGHLSGHDYHELSSAYVFLRTVEHRLQLRHGQQTHRIPERVEDCVILGRSVRAALGDEQPEQVSRIVAERMASVSEIYARIIHQQENRDAASARSPGSDAAPPSDAGAITSFSQLLGRLQADSPEIYADVCAVELSPHGRRNLFRFFASGMTSAERYAAVLGHPRGVQRSLRLFETSDFVADALVRHPDEVEALEALPPPEAARLDGDREPSQESGDLPPRAGPPIPREQLLAAVRRQYRHRVVAAAAQDLLENREIFAALRVCSANAISIMRAAFSAVAGPAGLAVFALGRLGTLEFDYGSDADIIFVHDPRLPVAEAAASASELVQALSAYTTEGALFSVDTRLRPRGSEGELVITPDALAQYFSREAQPWEAISYTKLRYVAGDRELAQQARQLVWQQLPRFAAAQTFQTDLREMRARLETRDSGRAEKNFKTSPGGTYDVDFVLGALLVTHGISDQRANLRDSAMLLHERGLLSTAHRDVLVRGATVLRALDHAARLVTGRPRRWLPNSERPAEIILQVAAGMIGADWRAMRAEIPAILQSVRNAYHELLPPQAARPHSNS